MRYEEENAKEATERPKRNIPYTNDAAESVGHIVRSVNECGSTRMSAHAALKAKIERSNRDLQALEVLERVIPWNILNEETESRLWDFFMKL